MLWSLQSTVMIFQNCDEGVMPCILLEWHQHFRGTYCLHLEGTREEYNGVEEASSLKMLVHLYQTTQHYVSEVTAVSSSYLKVLTFVSLNVITLTIWKVLFINS
jgi:hypothetical protein